MILSEWREFPSAPCLAEKKNLMTARVSMLLKSRASLTCFRACFLPGRAKDLPAPRYQLHGATYGKTEILTAIAVRTSHFTNHRSYMRVFSVALCLLRGSLT